MHYAFTSPSEQKIDYIYVKGQENPVVDKWRELEWSSARRTFKLMGNL
jgi:hypothetical protein